MRNLEKKFLENLLALRFHAIHTQVVIDNAGYICYAEARFLGHQNDAKQFTMMQQIGVIGPLHFLEDCILLATL
jgi:hypothetical protein